MSIDSTSAEHGQVIRIRRTFDAPRPLVFRQWTRAEDMAAWFAPAGYETTHCEVDARVGGRWHVSFASAAGTTHHESGEFLELEPPERLVLTLMQRDERAGIPGPVTVVTVVLEERDGATEMVFEQTGYPSAAMRDANAAGWEECLDKLERRLA